VALRRGVGPLLEHFVERHRDGQRPGSPAGGSVEISVERSAMWDIPDPV